MTVDQRFTITISLLTLLFLIMSGILGLIVRAIIRWTKVEDKLDNVIKDVSDLVVDKDKTHNEMLTTMREDRAATDRRLRWLEENLWKQVKDDN